MALELIVFDWDGTLMDSTAAIVAAIQLSCRDLGLPIPSRERAAHVIGLGLRDALARAVPELSEEQIPEMVERYRHYYLSRDGTLELFAGARELLVELKERGKMIAVATGKSRLGLNRALSVTQLQAMFDATRCADESFSKPHPAMLLELMEQLDAAPERTIMIGDTTHDLLMAANARTRGLGVSYGAHHENELRTAPMETLVGSITELREWLLRHL